MNINDLKQEFPFRWRVQSFSSYKPQATCVAYCDSRDVQNVLDAVCGQGSWQDLYYDLGGVTYCKIGIYIGDQWVWKSDCGINTARDASISTKGESSDAFKRAAVKWGVGRFLYSMRPHILPANKKKESGDKGFHLFCLDDKKEKLPDWYITDYINNKRGTKKAVPASNPNVKGAEASDELKVLEDWVSRGSFDDALQLRALEWIGLKTDAKELKRIGLASVPRVKYAVFCALLKIASIEDDVIDMCLESFDYNTLGNGGIAQVVESKNYDRFFDECELHKEAAKKLNDEAS